MCLSLADVLEACSWERLEAECPADYVIILDHARFGRLHLGKCVKQNFGYLGCVSDVRFKIDPLCSGKQKCSLDVYQTLQNERPNECSELEAFLQIEYTCVPGKFSMFLRLLLKGTASYMWGM
jgi:hypothetical protein